jgi:hypothetical protein
MTDRIVDAYIAKHRNGEPVEQGPVSVDEYVAGTSGGGGPQLLVEDQVDDELEPTEVVEDEEAGERYRLNAALHELVAAILADDRDSFTRLFEECISLKIIARLREEKRRIASEIGRDD